MKNRSYLPIFILVLLMAPSLRAQDTFDYFNEIEDEYNIITANINPGKLVAPFATSARATVTLPAKGESCIGSQNGRIDISANSNHNYTATLAGNGVSETQSFTSSVSFSNLKSGLYSECAEGALVDDLQSAVTFQWEASESADYYEVNLKNLIDGSTQLTESGHNESTITLASNTPYEWFVVSKSKASDTGLKSATWKFYNAGGGVVNYAPFPAEALYPKRGGSIPATTKLSLQWQASDVDGDIEDFEVFLARKRFRPRP
ncbi:hypothetical protein SAMN05421766_102627 [Zobellia uliginosa]|uniref:Uncharacterized protein n=1 Tax=Zobellia uliginosa TaxID=143224 RepID=A0ABY1KP06_9FLAO|nr:hypothetical protein [Zobellia uliginosa]SIS53884.1 hypothetical protein SAMN05421766_102627 [Zobellia uliginosa]